MTSIDNIPLHQLYDRLEELIAERKHLRQYRDVTAGLSLDEVLQELDEEEIILRAKIEELSIVEEDYSEEL